MTDEKLKFILRIGGRGLSDAAYKLPKRLGRQAPLRSISVQLAERGVKPSIKIPDSGPGMPFIATVARPRD
jgi:hypothetical protein